MVKHQHPSGRPVRRERVVAPSKFNYLPDPSCVYATPRLRPKQPLPATDAVSHLRIETVDDDWQGVHWGMGFVIFGEK